MANAGEIIEKLRLSPHPEGGWFRETWRAAAPAGERASGTAILFLLEEHQSSRWHRIDADEIWHWYLGAPLMLSLSPDGRNRQERTLGPDLGAGAMPQIVIPKDCWQAARPLGGFTLVGCTVSPGFEFEGFEMAPDGWQPGEVGA